MPSRYLVEESIPCWTRLVWMLPDTIAIHVRKSEIGRIEALNKSLIRTPDQTDMPNALVRMPEEDGYIPLHLQLPLVRKQKDTPCEHCDGVGKTDLDFESCLYCNGIGRETYYDWPTIFPIAHNASTLLEALYPAPKVDGTEKALQLLVACTYADERFSAINGIFSTELVSWIKRMSEDSLQMIIRAMKDAHIAMTGYLESFLNNEFQAWERNNGWFVISCPGDACEVHPNEIEMNPNGGYGITCHNIDSPIQMFTLLAGIAQLETLADRELRA